jgi:hypothetical protein
MNGIREIRRLKNEKKLSWNSTEANNFAYLVFCSSSSWEVEDNADLNDPTTPMLYKLRE